MKMNSVERRIQNILDQEEQWSSKLFTIQTAPNYAQNKEEQNIQNELKDEYKFDHTEGFPFEIGPMKYGKEYHSTIINPNEAKTSNEKQKQ